MLGGERNRKQADKCVRSVCVHREDRGCCGRSPEGNREMQGAQSCTPGLGGAAHRHGWRKRPIPARRLAGWSSRSPRRVL